MVAFPVGTLVNKAGQNEAECIQPLPPDQRAEQRFPTQKAFGFAD
jgi:hypothetical protein